MHDVMMPTGQAMHLDGPCAPSPTPTLDGAHADPSLPLLGYPLGCSRGALLTGLRYEPLPCLTLHDLCLCRS